MINNYGLLWRRKYVHLGAGSNKGTLLGKRGRIGEVDFREQIGIYVLYDKDFIPVYVGQAGNGNADLFTRLKNHTDDHLWNRWDYFSWFGLRKVNANRSLAKNDKAKKTYKTLGSGVLNEIEGVLIAAMEPKLNKQGPKFSSSVHQYSQEIDDNIDECTLDVISEKIDEIDKQIRQLQKRVGKGQ